MNLSAQRRIAADVLNCGVNRVKFDNDKLNEIKEALTKEDIRGLIKDKVIQARQIKGIGKFGARKNALQKRKKLRNGPGSRKGKTGARLGHKVKWMAKIRLQRKLLNELKTKSLIEMSTYRMLRKRTSGGFFRSRKHVLIYLTDNKLFVGKKK